MSNIIRIAILVAAGALAAGPAFAHARLKAASPSVGGTVKAAPRSIDLTFSERIEARYCGVALSDAGGKPVKLGPAAVAGDGAGLVVPIEATLTPGTYKVDWHAVSVDTHRTQGSFRFTVAP